MAFMDLTFGFCTKTFAVRMYHECSASFGLANWSIDMRKSKWLENSQDGARIGFRIC